MNCMQERKKWYRGQLPKQNNIIAPTCTIVHPYLDDMTVTEVKNTKSVCNITQACRAIQRRHIYLMDSDHDYILYEIKFRDTIEYEKKLVLMIVVNNCN